MAEYRHLQLLTPSALGLNASGGTLTALPPLHRTGAVITRLSNTGVAQYIHSCSAPHPAPLHGLPLPLTQA